MPAIFQIKVTLEDSGRLSVDSYCDPQFKSEQFKKARDIAQASVEAIAKMHSESFNPK